MINLEETYRRLARSWSHEQLGAIYGEADRRGGQVVTAANDALARPIASLAAAIPSITTLSVAIHVLHSLPQTAPGSLGRQLLETAAETQPVRCITAIGRSSSTVRAATTPPTSGSLSFASEPRRCSSRRS